MVKKYDGRRLDWRDADMPVLVQGNLTTRHADGRVEQHTNVAIELTPEERQQASSDIMRRSIDPDWRNDPTYFAKKKKKSIGK